MPERDVTIKNCAAKKNKKPLRKLKSNIVVICTNILAMQFTVAVYSWLEASRQNVLERDKNLVWTKK